MNNHIPNPLGVKVKKPYESEEIPNCCHIIDKPDQWVGDALGSEFKRWCVAQPVLIAAPTGSGKTAFTEKILKHCRKNTPAKKVLLLEPRKAITAQQKKDLAAKLGSKWGKIKDLSALDLVDDFDDIGLTIMTYQKFAACSHKMDLQQFAWVIFDEAHYFYSDSCFNVQLDQMFWKLSTLFRSAHRVYLTATPGAVLDDICRAEWRNLQTCQNCHFCVRGGIGKLLLYRFPNHFDRVNLSYFHKVEEIADLVKSHPNEKVLVFTAAREDHGTTAARSYVRSLESCGIKVAYLDRFSKGTETWRCVCNTGTFDAQVLVCTSVLDCGVNLRDPKLRHIIVEVTDKTEFLQMIGRKRLASGESINVYIRALNTSDITSRLKEVQDSLNIIYQGFQAANAHTCDLLIHRGWNDESSEHLCTHLLNYLGDGKVFPKMTAYHYLRWQKATLERLLRDAKAYGDSSALPRLAHEWLDQSNEYDPTHWLDYDKKAAAKKQLAAILQNHVNGTIPKKEWPAFSKMVTDLVNIVQKFPHDRDRVLDYQAVNTRLSALALHYRIISTKCGYHVEPVEEDAIHE